jgi:S1-C subfamily serine protease
MQGEARIRGLAGRLASALLLLAGPHALAAGPDTDPARRLEAVVRVQAEIPAGTRTASLLGTKRASSGVVIDDAGLIVTIGYLITEAMAAEVTTAAGRASRAKIIGFDTESGLGVLRSAVRPRRGRGSAPICRRSVVSSWCAASLRKARLPARESSMAIGPSRSTGRRSAIWWIFIARCGAGAQPGSRSS